VNATAMQSATAIIPVKAIVSAMIDCDLFIVYIFIGCYIYIIQWWSY